MVCQQNEAPVNILGDQMQLPKGITEGMTMTQRTLKILKARMYFISTYQNVVDGIPNSISCRGWNHITWGHGLSSMRIKGENNLHTLNIHACLKGILAVPFPFHEKMRQEKDKWQSQKVNCMMSLQHSTLNVSQQTLRYTGSHRMMSSGLPEVIITLLLQYFRLIAVKSLGALGSNWPLYQARVPLLPSFSLCHLSSPYGSADCQYICPAQDWWVLPCQISFGIIYNNLIIVKLVSEYFTKVNAVQGGGDFYECNTGVEDLWETKIHVLGKISSENRYEKNSIHKKKMHHYKLLWNL